MRKAVFKVLGVLIVVVVIISLFSGFIIDMEWYKEVGYLSVFLTSFKVKALVFVPSFIIIYLLVNFYARFLRKNYARINNIVYEKAVNKRHNSVIALLSAIASLLVSIGFTGTFWYNILEFLNATDFNIKDPLFNKDIGFYVFKLPLIQSTVGILITVIILLIIVTFIFYSILKVSAGISGLRGLIRGEDNALARFIVKQLAIQGGILLFLFSAVFYLKGINLLYSSGGVAFGAGYTDVHITLPMYRIISVCCILAAFIVAYSIIRKKIKPIIYTVGVIFALVILQGVIAGGVEQFIVNPNAREKEMPYLKNNIDYTRMAFNLNNMETKNFPVSNTLTVKDLKDNKDTVDNIRINEFSQTKEVYNQIQAISNYYKFNDVDIDRYNIGGKLRQTLISARELDNTNRDPKFQTWQNKHLFYTHGYGVVMSPTNTVNDSGLPEYFIRDIPPVTTNVKLDKPQIYFGEVNDDYVIVNGKSNEIDYPSGTENKENRYNGNAGIKLTFLNRLLLTVDYGSLNFLLSNDIDGNSRIFLNRSIVNRVQMIAPFINYDSDPYLVLSNGRLYWIIDGYTTSSKFPYSEPSEEGYNYIRNSVKVVVDAYDGTVDFYLADKTDAMAKTIGRIYSGLFKDISLMPQDLRDHLRYSEDVLMAQAKMYEKYHMSNPEVFYNSEDLWGIAKYKDSDGSDVVSEPVYQIMKLPGEDKEQFVLTIPFTAAKKGNMVSWLAVGVDNGIPKTSVIIFPKDKGVYGPQQFNSMINTNTEISSLLTLLGQKGSQVILGETNIIPIKNSLIYVRPLYLKAQTGMTVPELKKVIVGYADRTVMADNIPQAFDKLFNTDISQQQEQNQAPAQTSGEGEPALVNSAWDLFTKAKNAQTAGDWASYGQYLKQLESVLNQLKNIKK